MIFGVLDGCLCRSEIFFSLGRFVLNGPKTNSMTNAPNFAIAFMHAYNILTVLFRAEFVMGIGGLTLILFSIVRHMQFSIPMLVNGV